ncbi:MAG: hypothetical protein ACJ780_14730 [Solirubrobacteraceae bacterium]|jgi:hypothetical protein
MTINNNGGIYARTVTQVGSQTINWERGAGLSDFEFAEQVRALCQKVDDDARAAGMSEETHGELVTALAAAATEAESPAPERSRLAAYLERARALTLGVTATAGLADALHGLIVSLGGS